ncbi:MAG: YciI family protein [Egibacteraceae bacterium]
MIAAHVWVTTSPDYLTRREPHMEAHIDRLLALRSQGLVVAGGLAPDGKSVDVFYGTSEPERLVEDDPFTRAGAWTAYKARSFSAFVGPVVACPPVALDGSRLATIVEGQAEDPRRAWTALVGAARNRPAGLRRAFRGRADARHDRIW